MPLIKSKSKRAFESNLKAELGAGKPKAQALAIAYSTQRRAKYAQGGTVAKIDLQANHKAIHGPSNEKLNPEHTGTNPMRDMIKQIMDKRRNRKGDHEGVLDLDPLDKGYEDSDMHGEDFLAQEDDMDMSLSGDNQKDNEDENMSRRDAMKKRVAKLMKIRPMMGHGDDNAPGKM